MNDTAQPPASATTGRLLVVAAALLWSSSGLFAKATLFDDWPKESRGMVLAFWRALFAGALLLPLVRGARWNWRLAPMSICFAAMNAAYLTALTLTTAANAIWLQSTAPLWIFVAGATLGLDAANRRDAFPLACGLLGISTILGFQLTSKSPDLAGVACGLVSGMCYAAVALSIRSLRSENGAWLVALNHLVAAVALLPFVLHVGIWPSPWQLAVLAAFGLLQMGVPYVLFARGLNSISSQEATLIGLLEPVLMPLWVYLAWGETPGWWTLAGGGFILMGLLVRYGVRQG